MLKETGFILSLNFTERYTIFNGLERNSYEVTSYNGLDIVENKTELLTILPILTGYHVTIDMGKKQDLYCHLILLNDILLSHLT